MSDTTPNNIHGTDADESFDGTDGAGTIVGGGGNDNVAGGGDADVISGGGGDDTLSGGQGDDIIRGGAGDDVINGGKDFDRAVYRGKVGDYTIILDAQGRLHIDDSIIGRDGSDTVRNVEEFNFGGFIYTYTQLTGLAYTGI